MRGAAADSDIGKWFTEQPDNNADDAEIAGWFRRQPAGDADTMETWEALEYLKADIRCQWVRVLYLI